MTRKRLLKDIWNIYDMVAKLQGRCGKQNAMVELYQGEYAQVCTMERKKLW